MRDRNRTSRRTLVATTAAALVGLGALVPQSASAATPLTLTDLTCESGGGRFVCNAVLTGGTQPYQYLWQNVFNAFVQFPTRSHGTGDCVVGQASMIRVTVTDSAGAHVTAEQLFTCNRVFP